MNQELINKSNKTVVFQNVIAQEMGANYKPLIF